jgi:hypothetical protein
MEHVATGETAEFHHVAEFCRFLNHLIAIDADAPPAIQVETQSP